MDGILEIYARFKTAGGPVWGRVEDGRVHPLASAPWLGGKPSGAALPLDGLSLLAPAEPTKIVCVGLNYNDHVLEMKEERPPEPKIFLKPPSALAAPGQAVVHPQASQQVEHEAELAMLIGRRVGPGDDAQGSIFGFTCANDITARDLQRKDGQWTRAKGFDGFCPAGPFLVRGLDPADLSISCKVNGQVRQNSRTSLLIFKPQEIVAFIAGIMTLEPGDLVLTGTPGGISPVRRGESVEVTIQGIGTLKNTLI